MEKIDFLYNGQWILSKMVSPTNNYKEGELKIPDLPDKTHKMAIKNQLPNGLEYRSYVLPGSKRDNKVHVLYHPKKQEVLATLNTLRSEDDDKSGSIIHPHSITWSQVNPTYAGLGLGKQLYLATLIHNGNLSSDVTATSKADNVWNDISKIPGIRTRLAPFKEGNVDRHRASIQDASKLDHNNLFPKVDL